MLPLLLLLSVWQLLLLLPRLLTISDDDDVKIMLKLMSVMLSGNMPECPVSLPRSPAPARIRGLASDARGHPLRKHIEHVSSVSAPSLCHRTTKSPQHCVYSGPTYSYAHNVASFTLPRVCHDGLSVFIRASTPENASIEVGFSELPTLHLSTAEHMLQRSSLQAETNRA